MGPGPGGWLPEEQNDAGIREQLSNALGHIRPAHVPGGGITDPLVQPGVVEEMFIPAKAMLIIEIEEKEFLPGRYEDLLMAGEQRGQGRGSTLGGSGNEKWCLHAEDR